MGRYLIRRFLFLLLVLVVVSFVTFGIFFKLPPGDPARRAAGRRTTPAVIQLARENLGLDQPWYVQYARFARGMIPWFGPVQIGALEVCPEGGCFLNEQAYFSYNNFIPVREEIYKRLPVSLTLALGASVIWLLIGLPIGIASAVKPRSLRDRAGMLFALFGVSAPSFWLGLLFLYLFWYKFEQWFGWGAPSSGLEVGQSVGGALVAGKFILPWVALSLLFAAFYARMVRSNLIETLSEDYIRTARAKGLSERRVIYKHGLRSALTPVVTMFGLDLGLLLGGAVITETVFALPGLGQYLIDSLRTNDFPAVMGVTIFASFFIIIANLVVDVVYAFLDPRVRYT
jgi:peptide/nickel transport system permease protein